MEKISHIVGGSARVGSADTKNAPPVRPGVPAFGRPIGESPKGERDELSTAQKAGLIRSDLAEQKRQQAESRMAMDMSNQFFANRAGAAGPSIKGKMIEDERVGEHELIANAESGQKEAIMNDEEATVTAPSKFAPRGSYVDVRA